MMSISSRRMVLVRHRFEAGKTTRKSESRESRSTRNIPLVMRQVLAIKGASAFAGIVKEMDVSSGCLGGTAGESRNEILLADINRNDGVFEKGGEGDEIGFRGAQPKRRALARERETVRAMARADLTGVVIV